METCHSVLPPIINRVPHPPPYRRLPHKIYSTLGHLIEIIEQLHSSNNLGTILQNFVAEVDDKSPANSQGLYVDLDPGTIIKIAQILRKLNTNTVAMATGNRGTNNASSASLDAVSGETPGRTTGGGERAPRASQDGRNLTLSKQDSLYLMKKIRDFEQKCKPLQEKNKKFLEKNMELTTINRGLKEQIRNIADENKKLKESLDQVKKKCSVLSRQLNQEKLEKAQLEAQIEEQEKLRNQISEQTKLITNMKQSLAEKDRRMEVLLHRKKRRLRMSAEHLSRLSSPCSTTEEEPSHDSDLSVTSSMSLGSMSDEDIQEELPQDESERVEKNYKKLMKEQLTLQKSISQLQGILGWRTDPQRYIKSKLDFETDLYIAQCKIDNLEESLAKYKEFDTSWVMEKEQLTTLNEEQSKQIETLKIELREVTRAYEDLQEQTEHLEFLVLETQENNKIEPVQTSDASVSTDDEVTSTLELEHRPEDQAHEVTPPLSIETTQSVESEMSTGQEYKSTIKGLEEKLARLLNGQSSQVATVMLQLKQAEQHVIDVIEVENTMQDLENKIISLQEENTELSDKLKKCQHEISGLTEKLARYRVKIDSQEQCLSLTRDEREELLQVKPKPQGSNLNSRLRLAEMGQSSVRERSLEREGSQERIFNPLWTPNSPESVPVTRLSLSISDKNVNQSEKVASVELDGRKETYEHFESLEANIDFIEPVNYDSLGTRQPRVASVPVIGTDHSELFHEVDNLQKQIQELQEENDVLKYELTQKCHGDGDMSGSDSEDSRVAELREICENLRERLQSAEATERQCKERLKLAEKHIMELELAESVMRDRVEEGNSDCDKLRKQIVRLQRKIRELKDINSDRETSEKALQEKVKYLEEAEAQLSQKVTELQNTNHILKQRLDVKDELTADVQLVETLTIQVKNLQAENNNLESKMIDLEENNEFLRENWRKVADEEAARRECLEEKIKVLESANNDLKMKLKDHESDLNLSSCPSIASEINEDVIEDLKSKIKELEIELSKVTLDKDEKLESLSNILEISKAKEKELTDLLKAQKVRTETVAVGTLTNSENNDNKECESTLSKSELLEKLNEMEKNEELLKEKISEMEKTFDKKLVMLEREIAEYQQQEDDLCTRIEELEDNEQKLSDKISKFSEIEMNYKNKIEELENRETSLTIRFSQRVEELERKEQEVSERFYMKIRDLEARESELSEQVDKLTDENTELLLKINTLEKHEKELSEKAENSVRQSACQDQENLELEVSASTNGMSVVVQDKYQSSAKLESEASVTAKTDDKHLENKSIQLEMDNKKLRDEVSKLKSEIKEAEKNQKALEDKFKRQEKKRKRSERADNVDDYDTIAREVVTFKLEVEQLRVENSDLHDRLMELDESEKNLLEKNEQLLQEITELKASVTPSDNNNCKLIHSLNTRIQELEEEEEALRQKLALQENSVKDSADDMEKTSMEKDFSDTAYNSSKEMVDKNVGTSDFMEGVKGGQDQGKPVSSMFERIQSLETENQELSAKLGTLTATDAHVRQLSDKVKALEENEDSLMERVMELEEEEDRLTRELNKLRKSAATVEELEQELTSLKETEDELNRTLENLKDENLSLKKSWESSHSDTGDIAIRLASVQRLYEDEKKKVESLLKDEEKWMKSMASEKKALKDLEDELASTQEKLEELQTEYENKLSEKDENEKVLQEEINKLCRENDTWKKKLLEYEKSNSELEDEIEACKISESRMFHRHQQLITQNEELELKLSKLAKLIPHSVEDSVDSAVKKDENGKGLMAENPEVVSENPLSTSIFSEAELHLLRNKTPDTELLGSMPLDMLRKMQDFDQREQNYQTKIQDLESKHSKLIRKIKVLQSKEKNLKHENKELQLELLKLHEPSSVLRASTSSLDMDKSGSEDGLDSDNQSLDGLDDEDAFKSDEKTGSEYDEMTHEELLLSVKLLDEKQKQDSKRMAEFEEWLKDLMEQVTAVVSVDTLEAFMSTVDALKESVQSKNQSEVVQKAVVGLLETVSNLRQTMEALQHSEEQLRISLAENELAADTVRTQYAGRIEQLEAQIHVMAKLAHKYQVRAESAVEVGIQADEANGGSSDSKTRFTSPARELVLETSKIINIDVPPNEPVSRIPCLNYSETVRVDVPPIGHTYQGEDYYIDSHTSFDYSEERPSMMDKAEDVLRQRIRELEKLEKHLRQQVSDLESDREELHEIARKDKTIIHEQNVRIRELQLAQRNLQEQIKSFETSENSLYARLDEVEAELENKDDRIRDLEVLEQRLKDLVKQYKLDEKILQTKSQTLESSVREMSEKEEALKQKVQNLETEKSAFSERSEYLQMRLKELENAEIDLAQRAKNQENIMQTLQNTVIELETFGANAHARVIELERLNFELQQRLHHTMTENSPLAKHNASLQQQCDNMELEISALRDLEIKLRQENEYLQKSENSLHQEVKALRIKELELERKVRDLEEGESVLKDKLSKLQRSENTLKYRVQELESSGIQAPSDLNSSQTAKIKLPRTLEECQRRIIVLQTNNAELQSRLQQQEMNISGTSQQEMKSGGLVSVPQAEYQTMQRKIMTLEETENQLEESDRLNTHLQETVAQLRNGKEVCGHEVEIQVLRNRLDQANKSVKMLQSPVEGQWITQGANFSLLGSSRSPRKEELVSDLDEAEVMESMTKMTAGSIQSSRPRGQKLARDHMIEDLMRSLQTPPSHVVEDDQWREIESLMEATGRGGEKWISVGKATSMFATDNSGNRSHGTNEELELGLALQSETDSQLYSQNDTVSAHHGNRVSPRLQQSSLQAPPLPQVGPPREGSVKVIDHFGDTLYVQSPVQDSFEDVSDLNKEMLIRRLGQSSAMSPAAPSVTDSVADSGRGTASVSIATSGMTLRERIAHIEKQLSARESDSAREFNSELDLTSWKARVQESNRKLELVEKENKHFKDEINKLEKELEEKTRLYLTLEAFLKAVESLLAEQNGNNEKELINRIEQEVEKVTSGIKVRGHRPDDITTDPAALSSELAKKDRELTAKRNEVDSLMLELRQWQQECRAIEDMRSNALDSLRGLEVEVAELQLADKQLKDLKDDYNTLRGQAGDSGNKSPSIAPLRARIVQLTNLCKEKDILIKRLVQELKRFKSGARSSPLVDELCQLETKSDHNHNLLGRSSSQSSLDNFDRMSVVSDTELIREGSPHRVPRPRSADIQNQDRNASHRHSYHGTANLPRYNRHHHSMSPALRGSPLSRGRAGLGLHSPHPPSKPHISLSRNNSGDEMFRTTQYVAIADYDPNLFSQSGHPRLELSLKEGDIVLVTGPLHDSGYVEGEVKGRVGLVPFSYLQPSSPHRTYGRERRVPEHLNASPERIAQLYNSLHGVHQSDTHAVPNGYPSTQLPGNQRPQNTSVSTGPPAPPNNFHVEKIIGSHSLMLAWQPVTTDSAGCSNGVKVTGYRVYKNGKIMVQPRGLQAAKAIIENINIQAHHRFGIQTVGVGGQVSELSEIMYEGVEEVTSDENSDTESEMDMASVLNVDEYKTGPKRLFMGIYDYDPTKNSPYDHPSCELAFSAGDVITVYGRQRGDGFYYGEINGVRGLVPTFFIEEMPQPPPRTKKIARSKQANKEEEKTEAR